MPAPTTFGALGHLFDTRDSAELAQDTYGKKILKPMRDTMKYTVLCTKSSPETAMFDKYRRKSVDPFLQNKYANLQDDKTQVSRYVSKYGTSLGQGDLCALPKGWVREQRNKTGAGSACSDLSKVSSLCITKKQARDVEDREWFVRRPASLLSWITEEEIQQAHAARVALYKAKEDRLEKRRTQEDKVTSVKTPSRTTACESLEKSKTSRALMLKGEVKKCIHDVYERMSSLSRANDL